MITYTREEERWNVGSHAAGIILGVAVGVFFLVWCARAKDGWATTGIILYMAGMIGSYVTSTIYHALPTSWHSREVLRRWDHAAIYWHIAGSYSPVTLVALRDAGWWGWGLFIFVWTAAIVGSIVSFRGLREHSHLETACFVRPGRLPPADAVCGPHRCQLAYCRRLFLCCRGSRLRLLPQPPLHPHHLPLLCPRRQHLPHRLHLARAAAIPLRKDYLAVKEVKLLLPTAELPIYKPCHAVVASVGSVVEYLI